jgi:hypothetical protein
LSDFCWTPEVEGSRASLNAEINARMKALRRCAPAQIAVAGGNRDVKDVDLSG